MTGPRLPDDLPTTTARWQVAGRACRDGTPVHLAVAAIGPRDAPAVVVAHGAGSSARFVAAAFARPVVEAGRRLVTYDLRGHGDSSRCPDVTDHHLDVQVADLAAVIASAAEVAAVGGVSLGGHAALRWAVRDGGSTPVVACLPAWLGAAAPGHGPHAAVADEVRRVGIAEVIERLRGERDLPRWLRDTLVADYVRHDPDSLTAALLALDGGQAPELVEVSRLRAQLGLVAWREDPGHPFEVAEALATTARRTALVELSILELDDRLDRMGAAALRALASA